MKKNNSFLNSILKFRRKHLYINRKQTIIPIRLLNINKIKFNASSLPNTTVDHLIINIINGGIPKSIINKIIVVSCLLKKDFHPNNKNREKKYIIIKILIFFCKQVNIKQNQ